MVRLTLSAPLWFLLVLQVCSIHGSDQQDMTKEKIIYEYHHFQKTHFADKFQLVYYALSKFKICDKKSNSFGYDLQKTCSILFQLGMMKHPALKYGYTKEEMEKFIEKNAIPKYQDPEVMEQYQKNEFKVEKKAFCKEFNKLDKLLEQLRDKGTPVTADLILKGYILIFKPFMQKYWIEKARQYVESGNPSESFHQFLDRIDSQIFLRRLLSILFPLENFDAFKHFIHKIDKEHFESVPDADLEIKFLNPEARNLKIERIVLPIELQEYFLYQKELDIDLSNFEVGVLELIELIRANYAKYEDIYLDRNKKVEAYHLILFIKLRLLLIKDEVSVINPHIEPATQTFVQEDPPTDPPSSPPNNPPIIPQTNDSSKVSCYDWAHKLCFVLMAPSVAYNLNHGISWFVRRFTSDTAPEARIPIDNSTLTSTISPGGSNEVLGWILALMITMVLAAVLVFLFKGCSYRTLPQAQVYDNSIRTAASTPRTTSSATPSATSNTKPSTTPSTTTSRLPTPNTIKPANSNLKTSTQNHLKKNHRKSPKHSPKLSNPKKSSPKGGSKM